MQHKKNLLSIQELTFVTFGGLFFFFEFLTFLLWSDVTFSILIRFGQFLVH